MTVRLAFIYVVLVALVGCAENVAAIRVVVPNANTPSVACGVAPHDVITKTQAKCIAKRAGLTAGMYRWQVREYSEYVDVFNTLVSYPESSGQNVRISRVGGRVLEVSPWTGITVRAVEIGANKP